MFNWITATARLVGRGLRWTGEFAWRHKGTIAKATIITAAGSAVAVYGAAYYAAASGVLETVAAATVTVVGGAVASVYPVAGVVEGTKRSVSYVARKVRAWRERRNEQARQAEEARSEEAREAVAATREATRQINEVIPVMHQNGENIQRIVTLLQNRADAQDERIQHLEEQVENGTADRANLRTEKAVLEEKVDQLQAQLNRQNGVAEDPGSDSEESVESEEAPEAPRPGQ